MQVMDRVRTLLEQLGGNDLERKAIVMLPSLARDNAGSEKPLRHGIMKSTHLHVHLKIHSRK